jgi:precorrin-6B C5,15-methyltransferase / cobalt-precorrin-6B C5,C15-methyltransferase
LIEVIGTDASGLQGLGTRQRRLVAQAELLAAPGRLLDILSAGLSAELSPAGRDAAGAALQTPGEALDTDEVPSLAPRVVLLSTDQPVMLIPQLQQALEQGLRTVVLASGDPLWFGIGRLLLDRFGRARLRFHPAPSSLQLAFARIGRPWQDASWVSLHGREPEPLAARLQQRPAALAVLTDPSRGGAGAVRALLRASGLEAAYGFWLCERLGHDRERVQKLASHDPLPADLDPLNLVLLVAETPAPLPAPSSRSADGADALPLFGLDDGLWLQHDDRPGLMTKREVRIQLLADLQLPARGVLWDLGAGVGSVGIEALRLRPGLQLWALEQRGGGGAVIRANAERFGVAQSLAAGGVIEGRAPQALAQLPNPDRVLIGGGGRERAAIVAAVLQRLRPGGIVVIPLATVEALAELRPLLEQAGLQVAVSQLQAWRGAPLADGTRLAPLNPVLVLRGQRLPAAG